MQLRKQVREAACRVGNALVTMVHTNYWMGFLWILLGVFTWLNAGPTDFLSIAGPVFVGIILLQPLSSKREELYFVFGFAVVVDRVITHAHNGLWTPLIVWAIVGTYVFHTVEQKWR